MIIIIVSNKCDSNSKDAQSSKDLESKIPDYLEDLLNQIRNNELE